MSQSHFHNSAIAWEMGKILSYDEIKVAKDTVGNYANDEGNVLDVHTIEVNDQTFMYESRKNRDQDFNLLLEHIAKYKP